jgi:hypothetical protein
MEDQLENELKSKNKHSNITFLKKKEREMDLEKVRKVAKIGNNNKMKKWRLWQLKILTLWQI